MQWPEHGRLLPPIMLVDVPLTSFANAISPILTEPNPLSYIPERSPDACLSLVSRTFSSSPLPYALTIDEVTAIVYFLADKGFAVLLNFYLRDDGRLDTFHLLFVKLLLTGLSKLPLYLDAAGLWTERFLAAEYTPDTECWWWSISSWSPVPLQRRQQGSTCLHVTNVPFAVDVREFFLTGEMVVQESILMFPGLEFQVTSVEEGDWHLVHLSGTGSSCMVLGVPVPYPLLDEREQYLKDYYEDHLLQAADNCYNNDRTAEALVMYLCLVNTDRSGWANFMCAVCFYDEDREKSEAYYNASYPLLLNAAKQGYSRAIHGLAWLYETGAGGASKSVSKALKMYQLAAEKGFPMALHNLGQIYDTGDGVAQDSMKAMKYYVLAATKGFSMSISNLGDSLYIGDALLPRNFHEAYRYFSYAASQGCIRAQNNLAQMHECGQYVPVDFAKALELYKGSAERGYATAQVNLGRMFEEGKGGPVDYQSAVRWYREAADPEALRLYKLTTTKGFAVAQNYLAMMYFRGRGVAMDYQEGLYYLRLAASQGNGDARRRMRNLMFVEMEEEDEWA